jgi:hypothetical protein
MRGHEANTSLLNDNLAKKQTLRTEKLQATGLMTRRHIRLRKVSEPHSRVELACRSIESRSLNFFTASQGPVYSLPALQASTAPKYVYRDYERLC